MNTKLVPISALVLDSHGMVANGLKAEDFVLKQDGKEVAIRYFSQADSLPLRCALLIDVSISQESIVEEEKKASDSFFESILTRPQDQAMLVEFDTKIQQLKAMTNDASLLRMALQTVAVDSKTSHGTRLQDAVYAIAEKVLSKETGRKVILLITDGGESFSRFTLADAVLQAQKENVAVYSICYRAQEDSPLSIDRRALSSMAVQADQLLDDLARQTGGRSFHVTRAMPLEKIFADIAEGLRSQYEVGYVPAPEVALNRPHKLELKTRDKRLHVFARTAFIAAP